MKKRIILLAVIAVLLLLFGFRYAVVEREDILPDDVRTSLLQWVGVVSAEVDSAGIDAEEPSDLPWQPYEEDAEAVETDAPSEKDTSESESDQTIVADSDESTEEEPVIRRGDRGDEVKALQQRLRDLGFSLGSADGIFGEKTEQAVIQFKKHLYELEQERLLHNAPGDTDTTDDTGATDDTDTTGDTDATGDADTTGETDTTGDADTTGDTGATGDTGTTGDADTTGDTDTTGDADTTGDTDATGETDAIGDTGAAVADESEPLIQPEFTGEVDAETYRLLVDGDFDEYQETLRLNAHGAEVRRLQERLRSLGYMTSKADGIYGKNTVQSVTAFQKRHKLTQDGVAGEKTQRALFSASAKQQVKEQKQTQQSKNGKYLLKVSTAEQKVYAYAWSDKDGAYTSLVRTMICSTGLASSPTPKGTFRSAGPVVEWGYFPKYDVWAQYLFRISGPYLFHSVLFDEADESTVKWGSVNKLGSPASHGCIRLKVEDARWIYKNCAAGTTVTVY